VSAHGRHAVEWRASRQRLEIEIEVPPNTTAHIVLPDAAGGSPEVRVDGRRRTAARRLEVGWGRHLVTVEG
jgi:hypothetical protein